MISGYASLKDASQNSANNSKVKRLGYFYCPNIHLSFDGNELLRQEWGQRPICLPNKCQVGEPQQFYSSLAPLTRTRVSQDDHSAHNARLRVSLQVLI